MAPKPPMFGAPGGAVRSSKQIGGPEMAPDIPPRVRSVPAKP